MTDVTWVTLAQIFGAALIGGIFTLLGVWISQRGAATAVKQTFEGQRVLARDAALRDYRKQLIVPYLEAARKRFRIWAAIHAEIGVGDRVKLLELQAQLTDANFHSLMVTYLEIPDDAFRAAFHDFVNAEGYVKSTYTSEEIMDKVKQMRPALIELSTASEHYLFFS
jgi:hypothetical protein